MDIQDEQRVALRLCVHLSKTLAETYDLMKQEYGDEFLAKPTVKRWHKDYSEGHETVGLASRGESNPTVITQVNTNTVAAGIKEDCHTSTRSLEAIRGLFNK